MRHYRIEAAFSNEDVEYGRDTFFVLAGNEKDAMGLGREAATQSIYDDDRIPDRHVGIEAEEVDPEDIPDGTLVYQPAGLSFGA